MLFLAFLTILIFLFAWAVGVMLLWLFVYGSLIFSYFVLWDDKTRKQICPHGLWSTIFLDK